MAETKTISVLTQGKEPSGEMELSDELFGGPVRKHLLHSVVKMQLANRRAGTASTKTKGLVSGGGKKPWKQKGTGRARAGSSRSPIWPGGGTVFGPQPRDYSYRMPASARRSALRAVLALKFKEGSLVVVDKIEIEAKTKSVAKMLEGLGLSSVLIITGEQNANLERATRNLPYAKVLRSEGANVYDILRYRTLLLTRDAVAALEGRMAP